MTTLLYTRLNIGENTILYEYKYTIIVQLKLGELSESKKITNTTT